MDKCKICNKYKEGYCCKECYLDIQGDFLVRVMEGSPNYQILNKITDTKYDIEERLTRIEKEIELLLNCLLDFNIRGFKLKSAKKDNGI